MQTGPEDARGYGLAAIIYARPEAYSFLPDLAGCSADQISIETAQPGLDLTVLADLADRTILLGVIDRASSGEGTPLSASPLPRNCPEQEERVGH